MIIAINTEKEIEKLHKRFHKQLDKIFDKKIDCFIGHPGGSFEAVVSYSTKLNVWISKGKSNSRFWNGFGIGQPIQNKNNSLIGEINFPFFGTNRRIAGIFAEDENGKILVLHRGKIGGGKLGIGKTFFMEKFRGDFVNVNEGDKESKFCLIGELYSKYFPNQISDFIHEIDRVKQMIKEKAVNDFNELSTFNYTEERFGQTVTENNEPTITDRTHGIVVIALAKELQNRMLQVANDKNRDLFVHNKGKILILFEIKTSSSTQCIYSAVGQLLIYSIPILNRVNLVAVFPNRLSKTVEQKLSTLNIVPLYFNWNNYKPKFLNLDEILLK